MKFNNGFLIQWTNGSGSIYTFPITFTTIRYVYIHVSGRDTNRAVYQIQYSDRTISSLKAWQTATNSTWDGQSGYNDLMYFIGF